MLYDYAGTVFKVSALFIEVTSMYMLNHKPSLKFQNFELDALLLKYTGNVGKR
jgi:hypothetical protein